ncbi:DUF2147 domain-containing protein [Aureibaculum luteum]|uniref:DUF2147 domain-containing protein n=1 Tax=Aureibaculum luteum TaxID=1548456 RepID=UPI000E54FBC7|nr:DUF2147 domain-containing protein [Aureibaculum luteum]
MNYLRIFLMLLVSITVNGQSIIGQWETYDDNTKEKKALIEIYQKDNLYFAKIVKRFNGDNNAVCKSCKGTNKNKPIVGLVIIENIKKVGNEFKGGTIMDPENGETYSCYLKLINANKLKIRGFLGFSVFGRTQYWIRKE